MGCLMIIKDRVDEIDQLIDKLGLSLSKPQKNHLKNYIHGLITSENKTIQGISNQIVDSPNQSNLNRFLTSSRINRMNIDRKRIRTVIPNRRGGTVVLDDTNLEKTGKNMEGAGYLYDHTSNKTIFCHNVVTSLYVDSDNNIWPLFNQPYLKENVASDLDYQFHTRIYIAKRIIGASLSLISPKNVVMDSWYFSKDLIEFIEGYDLGWVTQPKCNRKIYHEGDEIRVDALPDRIPEEKFEDINVEVSDTKYINVAKLQLKMKNIGKIGLLVLEKENSDYEYMVTNRTDYTSMEVLKIWKQRWSIETLHKDCKQELGLGAYQMRNMNGIVIHLSLVFLAYALLKALSCYSNGLLNGLAKTIGEACRWIMIHLIANLTSWVIELYESLEDVGKVVELVKSKCVV